MVVVVWCGVCRCVGVHRERENGMGGMGEKTRVCGTRNGMMHVCFFTLVLGGFDIDIV